jgi:Luciferase-like monooxygenase
LNLPIAVALRSALYRPKEILEFSRILDEQKVQALFFPDIPQGYDALHICAAVSARTSVVEIATGVIRPLEFTASQLERSIATLQFLSGNRFVLGAGTGYPGAKPSETIAKMLAMIANVNRSLGGNLPAIKPPPVLIAALRYGIASKVISRVDGIILNFCSPQYASELLAKLGGKSEIEKKTIACYMKIFYASDYSRAKKLLLEEFVHYNAIPWYHDMFERMGASGDIAAASMNMDSTASSGKISERLLEICLANPSQKELSDLIDRYRETGVNLPCLYPYFSVDEESAFKEKIIRSFRGI